jgi:hypothetical protein
MVLNDAGKLALLESNILPHYNQLRFVAGRSRIATLILAVQAIGYVTSIVYRAIHHLPVSPIEAIGFAFSLLVIVHSLLHNVGGICRHTLVIYVNHTEAQEPSTDHTEAQEPSTEESRMTTSCAFTRWQNVDTVNRAIVAIVGTVVVGSVVVALTILVELHVLRKSWLDKIGPILFLLSFIPESIAIIILTEYKHPVTRIRIWIGTGIRFGSWMISCGAIVVSIVATILNWQTHKFDSRTPSLIHNLPFLG